MITNEVLLVWFRVFNDLELLRSYPEMAFLHLYSIRSDLLVPVPTRIPLLGL